MSKILSHPFRPKDLLVFWAEARRALEMDLADQIYAVIELKAAEEEGAAHRGRWG
jgi:hypothetical protein